MVILPKDGLELYHTNVNAQMAKASTISVTILLKYVKQVSDIEITDDIYPLLSARRKNPPIKSI